MKNKKRIIIFTLVLIMFSMFTGVVGYAEEGDGAISNVIKKNNDDKIIQEIIDSKLDNYNFIEYKGWIYYTKEGRFSDHFAARIFRIKKDGTKDTSLGANGYISEIKDDWIYFRNMGEHANSLRKRMYKMKLDGSQKTEVNFLPGKVIKETDKWVYEYENLILYKITSDRRKKEKIIEAEYGTEVRGDYIYCSGHKGFFCVKIDENIVTKISDDDDDEKSYELEDVIGEWIYYSIYYSENDTKNLYRVKHDGTSRQLISQNKNFYKFEDEWIYLWGRYSDKNQNTFYRIKLDGTNQTKIIDNESDFKMHDGKIYYTDDESKYSYSLNYDGSDKVCIGKNIFIHKIFNDWIIYTIRYEDGMYKMKSDGSGTVKISEKNLYCYKVDGNNMFFHDDVRVPNYSTYYSNEVHEVKMSIYKFNINEDKMYVIAKDVDLNPPKYKFHHKLYAMEFLKENPVHDLKVLNNLNVEDILNIKTELIEIIKSNKDTKYAYGFQINFPKYLDKYALEYEKSFSYKFKKVVQEAQNEINKDSAAKVYIHWIEYYHESEDMHENKYSKIEFFFERGRNDGPY